MKPPLLLLFLMPFIGLSQTCDLALLGYTPPAVSDGLHSFQVQWLNTENCGCNEFTQFDGNTCEESGGFHVGNNESVSHLVFGLHYVDEVTGEDYGENTDCTSNTFHPGWSYVMTSNNTGWTNGFSNFILNPPFSWDCIIENEVEGYCWEVVIWQINVSQTADYEDFPFPEGWSNGTSFNQTQTYPDINLSDNRITFCPDPTITDTVYVYETDTVFVELPADTITLIDTLIVDNYIEVYMYDTTYIDNYIYVTDTVFTETLVYDTTYVDVVLTEYIYLTDTVTLTEYSVVTEYIDCDSGLPCEDVGGMVCEDVDVFIPNAATPNGDGINDSFYAVTDPQCWREWDMRVYNRWGQVVWSGEQPGDQWYMTGTASGTYVYSLRASKVGSSQAVNLTGHVLVLK